jgi:hypothetical protein
MLLPYHHDFVDSNIQIKQYCSRHLYFFISNNVERQRYPDVAFIDGSKKYLSTAGYVSVRTPFGHALFSFLNTIQRLCNVEQQ